MKLLSVQPSTAKGKKLVAKFERKNGNIVTTHFGAKGMSDYTIHKDDERKQRYISRHKKNENWNDPTSAGALSRYILWGPTTSKKKNISLYKSKYGLA